MSEEILTIPIIPVDTSRLPNRDGLPIPRPSIEHTLIGCERCGTAGWIGPHQLAHHQRGGGEAICYYCLFAMMREGQFGGATVIGLDPSADEKPRRT